MRAAVVRGACGEGSSDAKSLQCVAVAATYISELSHKLEQSALATWQYGLRCAMQAALG